MKNPLFIQNNSCVISGIKYGDGQQRRLWLIKLKKENTYSHKHKKGQLYYYPFRDYRFREFPMCVINKLKEKYPNLSHSGCNICPILLMFPVISQSEPIRFKNSLKYAKNLGLTVIYNKNKLIDIKIKKK